MANERRYQTGKHLEAFVLLLIAEHPDHGGALITRLKECIPAVWNVDDGHVYRLLRTLEAEGAVTSEWITPDAGAPLRVYQLTDNGRTRLYEWKDDILVRRESFDRFLTRWERWHCTDD